MHTPELRACAVPEGRAGPGRPGWRGCRKRRSSPGGSPSPQSHRLETTSGPELSGGEGGRRIEEREGGGGGEREERERGGKGREKGGGGERGERGRGERKEGHGHRYLQLCKRNNVASSTNAHTISDPAS